MSRFCTVVTAVALWFAAAPSFAGEDEDQSLRTLAVQNREHTMTHEFTGWVGTLPMDAFTKGLTFSGGYSIHFTDFIGWEVGNFTYSYHVDTSLKEDLRNLTQPIKPTQFEVINWYLTTNLLLKPMYGKMSLFNRSLIYGEVFIALGGGIGFMTITRRPVVDAGVGFRVYVNKVVSFRIDGRWVGFVNLDDFKNDLWLALGISLSFG